MLRKNAKLELLKRVPLFERCSKRELEEISRLADEVTLAAGRELTKEGTSGKEFVVIVDGSADVRRKGRKVNSLRSGDFLGEIALVTGMPRTATVTTTTQVRVLVITAPAFRSLLRRMPSLQLKVLDALAARLPAEYS
ncbi:MAG TPA: cyclic nucleotide-binding domain-containing protein [Gaiellaceae bacterium]|nr:cyclic nucleotide-binding domain-containing protein [Gaiellaceae bacterium]